MNKLKTNKLKINFDTSNLNKLWQEIQEQSLDNAILGFFEAHKRECRRRVFWFFVLFVFSFLAGFCLIYRQHWFIFPCVWFLFLWVSQTRTLLPRREQKRFENFGAYIFLAMKEVSSIAEACTLFEALFSKLSLQFANKHCIQLYALADLARRIGWLAPFAEIKEENIFRHKYHEEDGILEIYYTLNNEDQSIAFPCEKRVTSEDFDSLTYEEDALIYNEGR